VKIINVRARYLKKHPPAIFPQPEYYYWAWEQWREYWLSSERDLDFLAYLGASK
jgi:hypothetical protein